MGQTLSESEVHENLKNLKEWQLTGNEIKKQFAFDSFMSGIEFINRVAGLAESADHHPDITVNYRRVTMALSTHSEGGLTQKDFDLARRIDAAA
jgi:4a-hydroxytetrahydrobiopterin dehydratase